MYDKKLVEAFSIKYGWSPEAVLSIPRDVVLHEMTREEFEIYLARMKELRPRKTPIEITYYDVVDGAVIVPEGEDW